MSKKSATPKGGKRSKSTKRRNLGKRAKEWKTYEEVARYVLSQIKKRVDLSGVHPKGLVAGHTTGVNWEIDAKGIKEADGSLVIIECRRYSASRLAQEDIAALAFRIIDTKASGGIVVSPHPLQSGATKVAAATGIKSVRLHPNSTEAQWIAELEDVIAFGRREEATVSISESLEIIERHLNSNIVRHHKLK